MNTYQLDEALMYLNTGKVQTLEDIMESINNESNQFIGFCESCNFVNEKVDFTKLKEKISQMWENLKTKIKAFIAKIEYIIKEAIRKAKSLVIYKKMIPDKLTLKEARKLVVNAGKFGFSNYKEFQKIEKEEPSVLDDDEMAIEYFNEYIDKNPLEIYVIDENLISKDTKNVSKYINYASDKINTYIDNCDEFENISKKYFKYIDSYNDMKNLEQKSLDDKYSHEDIDSFTKFVIEDSDKDGYGYPKLEIPETFKKKISISDYDDIVPLFKGVSDYCQNYIDIISIRNREQKAINKLTYIVKSGDNYINKIKSKLHPDEDLRQDPSIYIRFFIRRCSEILEEGLKFNASLSNFESYYKKLYSDSLYCIIFASNKLVRIASIVAEKMKTESK